MSNRPFFFFELQKPNLVSFDYNALCPIETGVDYMAILVVFEVVLLALILTKLTYDVWQYRRTGELPWLARHICLGYNYANINKTNNRNSNNSNRKRNGVGGLTPDDDAVQFVDNGSESPTHLSDDSVFNLQCVVDCFRCANRFERTSSSNLDKGSNRSHKDIVMFRPRRQTENSANNSNGSDHNNKHKSSPLSLSAVTLRKTSKMGPPVTPRKSPTQSKASTNALKLPAILPTSLLSPNHKDPVLEVHSDEDPERKMRILFLRGLKGSTSEDRLSFRTVMEPLPMLHSRTFTGPDSRFMNGLNKSRIKRNISKSTSTLQNSVAL